MAKPNRFTLTILGIQARQVRCQKFQREEFRYSQVLPDPADVSFSKEEKKKLPKLNPKAGLMRSPLCPDDVLWFETQHSFNDISTAFKNQSLLLDERHLSISGRMTVESFQQRALEAYPKEETRSKAYDLYAREIAGKSYSDMILEAKNLLIEKFRAAFEETEFENVMVRSRYSLGLHNQDLFIHPEIVSTDRALRAYKRLAKQGHVYSQYLAGTLLATSQGNYSPECIEYLLDAYENEHPDALDLLSRFLLLKEDYLGAFQCGLLSCESGQRSSQSLLNKTLQQAGLVGSDLLVNKFLDDGFKSLASKHSRFKPYDPKNPPIPAFLARQMGR